MEELQGYGWLLLQGTWMTIVVGVLAMVVAVLLGLVGAAAKLSPYRAAKWTAETYTTVIRGVPELVLILLVYYGVPTLVQELAAAQGTELQIDLDPFVAGTVTIGFIYGAFATEVLRGAALAVPRGQMEAARACGMSQTLAIRRILLPQMMRYALPGLGNVWLVLIKATALISVIQLQELMRSAQIAAGATREPFTFYFAASLLYLAITLVSQLAFERMERWAARGVRRA